MSQYQYGILYRPTSQDGNAYALSCLPFLNKLVCFWMFKIMTKLMVSMSTSATLLLPQPLMFLCASFSIIFLLNGRNLAKTLLTLLFDGILHFSMSYLCIEVSLDFIQSMITLALFCIRYCNRKSFGFCILVTGHCTVETISSSLYMRRNG